MRSIHLIMIAAALWVFAACTDTGNGRTDWKTIETVFADAPDSIQTTVYWYWISDNVSKQGVINDLHAMKRAGINRAFIGNIGLDDLPAEAWGSVKLFSDEWWDVVHTALKTATELGIDIGIFNSPGWSQSGGPWVKPEQAMRYLTATDTLVKGPGRFRTALARPQGDFRPVGVTAFRAPKDYGLTLAASQPEVSGTLTGQPLRQAMDGNRDTEVRLPHGTRTALTFSVNDPFTARSLTVYPARRNMIVDVALEVQQDTGFHRVRSFRLDRSNNSLNVGFEQFAPVTVSFGKQTGTVFRLVFDAVSGDAGIAEIELAAAPQVERFKEKTLARMHPTPLPYWHDYQWEVQTEPDDTAYRIAQADVKDLTANVGQDGVLSWDIPEGDWIILQTGVLPTGVTNGPASTEGRGLEIDKMSSEYVVQHFDAFLGEIMRRIPAEDRKTFKVAVQDSYETGGQNWTDGFEDKFQRAFGYDPRPYIPVYFGHVVGSQEESDRFLWDVRRFVADQVAYEYVGGLRAVSNRHGLTTWLENYGHWGFPGEFLQYGGQSDEIAGEFWSEGELGDIENRAASSAAHIYGKNRVSAESFTAAGNTFGRYPAMFKQRGDRFFAEGINNTLLHVYIHQPYEDRRPGVNAWFGNEFNRFNTWYDDMDGFIDYIKRCNYMLQQGRYVADVAYFIGEDAPKMTGVQDPAMPKGYSFDYMNAEVILNRMTVRDGRFTLPDGLSYAVLVLPRLETMRPAVLRKIETLVKAGGTILGPRPQRSPSLAGWGTADGEVQELAAQLWGTMDGNTVTEHAYGKGRVFEGLTLDEVFDRLGLKPDVELGAADPVVYLHRTLPEGEIYFVSNQSDRQITIDPAYRITGRQPEHWDAVTGTLRDLPEFDDDGQRTRVPLQLAGYESAFIVFRKDAAGPQAGRGTNFHAPHRTVPVAGPWEVVFTRPDSTGFTVRMADLVDWSAHPDTAVNYFAGSAAYTGQLPAVEAAAGERIYLELGSLTALAKVHVNGQAVGGVWTPPYRLDITDAWKPDGNVVEIRVVNTWVNRLIGDQRLPEANRSAWTIINPYRADSPLRPAGLLGPVAVQVCPGR